MRCAEVGIECECPVVPSQGIVAAAQVRQGTSEIVVRLRAVGSQGDRNSEEANCVGELRALYFAGLRSQSGCVEQRSQLRVDPEVVGMSLLGVPEYFLGHLEFFVSLEA